MSAVAHRSLLYCSRVIAHYRRLTYYPPSEISRFMGLYLCNMSYYTLLSITCIKCKQSCRYQLLTSSLGHHLSLLGVDCTELNAFYCFPSCVYGLLCCMCLTCFLLRFSVHVDALVLSNICRMR